MLVHTQQEPGLPVHIAHGHAGIRRNAHPDAIGIELITQLKERLPVPCERQQSSDTAGVINQAEFPRADRLA